MYRTSIFLITLWSAHAMAYPEYAVRYNVVSCSACHLSPVGGGPKTINGKLFAAHGFKLNPFISQQDYISVDMRALFYYPQRPSVSSDGMGIMSGSVAGHVALDEEKRIHLVLEHNIAGFTAASARDTYARFDFTDPGKYSWTDSLMVGRFRIPYGIVDDEHRTYVHVQTATEWYTFETGLLLSGTPNSTLHYDVGLVNGENANGQTLNQGQAERFGGVLNVRWMPGPFMLGTSGRYDEHKSASDSRKATAVYGLVSISRWTSDRVPVEVQIEHDWSWGWDANLGHGFAGDGNYVTALGNSEAQGWLARVEWYIRPRLVLIYKFDDLTPDRDFPSDYYQRHSLGIRYYVAAYTMIQLRNEWATATPPTESSSKSWGAQNATYGLLQVGF